MKSIRIGLIGYGLSGATFHAPLISAVDGFTLVRVASSHPEKVLRDFPHAIVSGNPDDMINADDIDLIVVATPNATHHALAKKALTAGKHVVLEKPFTVTLDEGRELIQLAREKDRVLSVFHNRRWDNGFRTARHCIESGALGEINTYQARFDRYRPLVRRRWREEDLPGSGTLYDLGSHLIDQALVLFGPPSTVFADVGAQRPGALAPDYFHLVLGYGNKRVILHSGSMVRHPGPHIEVHGSRGSYIKHGLDPQEDALKQGLRPGCADWGKEPASAHGLVCYERDGQAITERIESLPGCYEAYYKGILDAVTMGKPVPVSAEDALKVIRITMLAMRSSAEKRVVAVE